jgi:hypothetical protein
MHMGVDRDSVLHVHVQQVCCGVHAMDVTNTHIGAQQPVICRCESIDALMETSKVSL